MPIDASAIPVPPSLPRSKPIHVVQPSLRELRKRSNMTLSQAGQVIRRSNSYISHAERGDNFCTFSRKEEQTLRAYYRLRATAPHVLRPL